MQSPLVAPSINSLWHRGTGISYLRAGEHGPALVFLHGWGAFKELWWMTLRDLGGEYRCFALDLPGHGESPLGCADTMSALADRVATFCDDLGLQKVTLFGHSMGGSVASEVALRRPDLLQRLFLVDAAIESLRMPFFTRIYLQPQIGWPAFRMSQLLGRIIRPLGMLVPHEHGGGWVRPWLRRASYLGGFDPAALYRLLQSLFTPHDVSRLAQIAVPTIVISGQFDALVPPRLSRHLASHIPGARYAVIRAAVHNPMDERPRTFCRLVRTFLAADQP